MPHHLSGAVLPIARDAGQPLPKAPSWLRPPRHKEATTKKRAERRERERERERESERESRCNHVMRASPSRASPRRSLLRTHTKAGTTVFLLPNIANDEDAKGVSEFQMRKVSIQAAAVVFYMELLDNPEWLSQTEETLATLATDSTGGFIRNFRTLQGYYHTFMEHGFFKQDERGKYKRPWVFDEEDLLRKFLVRPVPVRASARAWGANLKVWVLVGAGRVGGWVVGCGRNLGQVDHPRPPLRRRAGAQLPQQRALRSERGRRQI